MKLVYFITNFLISFTTEMCKWLTKGVYRIFRNAFRDAIASWKMHTPVKARTSSQSLGKPIFEEAYDPNKKRKRRGHRGGRKHKRHNNHNGGGHHHG